jgi:putative transcriptional regulator
MTLFLPTCAEVTALLSDYEDGALRPLDWLGVKVHLSLCPPCRTFLQSLRAALAVLQEAWPDQPTPPAEQALAGALARLRDGRLPQGPRHHPGPEDWIVRQSDRTPFLPLLLRAHLAHCDACRETQGEILDPDLDLASDPLAALRPHLPPESQWRWLRRGLGGGRAATLLKDQATGYTLNLACLPGGRSTPFHAHNGFEGIVLLQGGLQDGPAHLRKGDWITHGPGDQHGPTADAGQECWALVLQERPVRFTGWRALFNAVS